MLIRLEDLPVGTLRRERGEQWVFRTLEAYRRTYPRPVLGQIFEDDLEREWRRRVRLPPFFSNLLPEGPLRSFLAQEVGVPPEREGFLLAHLGQDLPGAVIAEWEEGEELIEGPAKVNGGKPGSSEDGAPLKFSLAGVQLKLSALQEERGLTVPASGQGGDWIVKLPLPAHAALPSVEWSMLEWADRAGFDVPDHQLVEVESIGNLPAEWPVRRGQALAVRRFDRPEPGRRIHQEDFAQVLDVYPTPEGKYRSASCETLGRILSALTGPEGIAEYVRRLVFVVLSGNGDAHPKNWSLVYPDPDGRTPELSPLYDQVYTRAFIEGDQLALKLGDERNFYRIDLGTFSRFADRIDGDPVDIGRTAEKAAQQIRSAWSDVRQDLPLTDELRDQVDQHLAKVLL